VNISGAREDLRDVAKHPILEKMRQNIFDRQEIRRSPGVCKPSVRDGYKMLQIYQSLLREPTQLP